MIRPSASLWRAAVLRRAFFAGPLARPRAPFLLLFDDFFDFLRFVAIADLPLSRALAPPDL
jgi:hypothetical protein